MHYSTKKSLGFLKNGARQEQLLSQESDNIITLAQLNTQFKLN